MSDSTPRLVPSSEATTDQPQFTLRGLLLLVSAVAAFLAIGIQFGFGWSVGLFVILYLLWITWHKRSIADFIIVALLSLVVIIAISLMTPGIMGPREASPRAQCQNNMREVVQAILSYQAKNGHLPPAYLADKNGTPLCSWRVLILPYLERSDITDLWKFDEPWDSPHNSKLQPHMEFYRCPGVRDYDRTKPLTNYVAVVGPGTAWEEDTKLNTASFKDGAGNTLLLVELKDSDFHWAEPRDLYVGQMATVINPKQGQGISSKHKGGVVGIFADKRVSFIREDTMPNVLKALLTRDGGEPVSPADFEH